MAPHGGHRCAFFTLFGTLAMGHPGFPKAMRGCCKTCWSSVERSRPPPPPRCIRREGTSEAVPEAVRQAVGGSCQTGRGQLLSVTNATQTVRETVAGHRLGALEGGGWYLLLFECILASPPSAPPPPPVPIPAVLLRSAESDGRRQHVTLRSGGQEDSPTASSEYRLSVPCFGAVAPPFFLFGPLHPTWKGLSDRPQISAGFRPFDGVCRVRCCESVSVLVPQDISGTEGVCA